MTQKKEVRDMSETMKALNREWTRGESKAYTEVLLLIRSGKTIEEVEEIVKERLIRRDPEAGKLLK